MTVADKSFGAKQIAERGRSLCCVYQLVGTHETRESHEAFAQLCKSQKLRWDPDARNWYFDLTGAETAYGRAFSDADKERCKAFCAAAKAAGFDVEIF
jgi:hypothetical protein